MKLSEASVKRMFAANHFTLERFEQVCQLAEIGLTDLAREVDSERNYISQLTLEQEREIVGNPKLFLAAVCALNHMTLEQIIEIYDIPKSNVSSWCSGWITSSSVICCRRTASSFW